MAKQFYKARVSFEVEYTATEEGADNIVEFAFEEGLSLNRSAKTALQTLFDGWAMADEHFIGIPGQSLESVRILRQVGPLVDFTAKEIS